MSKHSTSLEVPVGDRFAYALYRVAEFVLRPLPLELVCVLGACMGQIAYFLMPRRRAVVTRNLRIAYGRKYDLAEIKRLARQTFRHAGSNLIASIPASIISNEELKHRVEIDGQENLLNALKQDKGCILLLAHMGNWEILTQLMVLVPQIRSLGSLYRPLDNPLLNKLVKRRRQSKGATLFSREDGFSKPITHLKAGGTLGCIADQNAGKHGMAVPLFGKLSSMTNLPALLHRKTKAPVVPLSMCMTRQGKWRVTFKPAINIPEEAKKDTYQVTVQCAHAYEEIMSESPADVLWMHNYWRGAKRTALKIRGQLPRNMDHSKLQCDRSFYLVIYTDTDIPSELLRDTLAHFRNYRDDLHITLVGSHFKFPGADYCLVIDIRDPSYLLANSLAKLQNTMSCPFDCALDLSTNGSGQIIFKQAGIAPCFAISSPPKPSAKDISPTICESNYEKRLEYFVRCITPFKK